MHRPSDCVAAGLPPSQPDCPDLRVLIIAVIHIPTLHQYTPFFSWH
jgi:hypothetical protein